MDADRAPAPSDAESIHAADRRRHGWPLGRLALTVGDRGVAKLAILLGALAVAAVLLGAVVVIQGVGRQPGSPPGAAPSPQASATATPSPLPSGGISQTTAIALARGNAGMMVQGFVSAVAGPFSELNEGIGPGADMAPTRLVWAVTLSGYAQPCPPNGATCEPPRVGTVTYYFDYFTGAFLASSGSFPAPQATVAITARD